MQISVNGEMVLFHGQSLIDLIQQKSPKTPYAIAVNTVFIPKEQYSTYQLKMHDQVDIVQPVVGG